MDLEVRSVTFISKFNVNGENIYGRVTWEDNQYYLFRIKLFDGRNTWSGRFSRQFAINCRSWLNETEEEFKRNVKLGLSGSQDKFSHDSEDSNRAPFIRKKQNASSVRVFEEYAMICKFVLDRTEREFKRYVKLGLLGPQYKFAYDFVVFPEDSNTACFTWKKVFEDGTVLAHGSVPVHLDDVNESKDTLIDFLINENKELMEVIETYNRKNDTCIEDLYKVEKASEESMNTLTQWKNHILRNLKPKPHEKNVSIKLENGFVRVFKYE